MSKKLKIMIGCDGCAYLLKQEVVRMLREDGYEMEDVGSYQNNIGYYLDVAEPVCHAVQLGKCDRGILLCGTGQGMNIAANKHAGIRSTICHDVYTAKMARADNDVNVLCLGAWMLKPEDAIKIVRVWLTSDYYGTNAYGLKRIEEFESNKKML